MKPYALIITANLQQAQRYQKALAVVGYQAQLVTTGASAQVQLAFTTPDLIVLDMKLPDMQGEVVLRQISAYKRLEHSTIIFLSTLASEMIKEKAYAK